MTRPKKPDNGPVYAYATYGRIGIIGVGVLLQLGLLGLVTYYLQAYTAALYLLMDVAGLVTVFCLINRHDSSAYRLAWIIVILVAPVFGLLLYFAWGRVDFNRRERGRLQKAFDRGFAQLSEGRELEAFRQTHPEQAPYAVGLSRSKFPLYTGTAARYFPLGEDYFDSLIADLEKARRFILMEYFIVAEGELWSRIHGVLRRKVDEGVEVRLLYDDVGCFFKIPDDYYKILRAQGIQAAVFSPAHRFVSSFYLNYRNHQKIVVIDGQVGYTGGVNAADEYINVHSRLGHWKDGGIRLEGSAVRSLSVIFFQMWNLSVRQEGGDDAAYLTEFPVEGAAGWFQPYADGPANNPVNPALDLIRQAAGGARHTLWMTSPYLILDQELLSDFCLAAKGGVDVRILTPAVPDHWYVGLVNRHNYRVLAEAGVKIYEYTPGFLHAKLMLVDGRCGTIGSVNLDFRSLYLHYENGVWICDAPVLDDIRRDMEAIMAVSHRMTLEEIAARPWWEKLLGSVFNLLSPLM